MWLIGYARVSKADGSQSLDLQRDALRAEGVDTSTSTTTSRPAYATTGPHVDAATPSGGNGRGVQPTGTNLKKSSPEAATWADSYGINRVPQQNLWVTSGSGK